MDTFKSQNRGGKGIKGMQTLEDDYIRELFVTTTHHYIMFFTNTGRVYRLKGYEIPEAGRTARGTAIINLLQLMPEEKITAMIPIQRIRRRQVSLHGDRERSCEEDPDQGVCECKEDRPCSDRIKGRRPADRGKSNGQRSGYPARDEIRPVYPVP